MHTGTIAFLFGVLLCQLLPTLPPTAWLLALVVPPLMLFPLHKRSALLLAALCAGLLWAVVVAELRLADSLPAELEGEDVVLLGQIVSLPERNAHRSRFVLETERLSYGGKVYSAPSRVRINWYKGAPELSPGQRWQLTVRMKRPRGIMNPGGFNYEQWLFQSGIRATGYVRSAGENRQLDSSPMALPVQRLRHHLKQRLEVALAGTPRAGIIQALAIGERSGIDDAEWALLLVTGTNHLMAISGLHIGLHIGLVAVLIYFLLLQL